VYVVFASNITIYSTTQYLCTHRRMDRQTLIMCFEFLNGNKVVNCVCLCACVPAKMAISKILVLVGTLFDSYEENSLLIILSDVFFYVKMQNVFCDG